MESPLNETKKKSEFHPSTMTIMAYSNISVDYEKIFKEIPITIVPITYTKKKLKPKMKDVKAPYGSVISVRYRNDFRGIITDPEAVEKKRLKEKMINKISFTEDERKKIIKFGEIQINKENKKNKLLYTTEYVPNDDEKYAKGLEVVYRDGYFLNQITVIISVGNKLINIMVFNNKYKIAGCKTIEQAYEAITLLWNYIRNIKGVIKETYNNKQIEGFSKEYYNSNYLNTLKDQPEDSKKVIPKFIFDIVMTNIDFFVGFNIDRMKLNNLMNENRFSDYVKMATFETTDSTNVNIKFYCPDIEKRYTCMYVNSYIDNFEGEVNKLRLNMIAKKNAGTKGKNEEFLLFRERIIKATDIKTTINNPYNKKVIKPSAKEKTSTLLVFESSKVIGSAKNYRLIKNVYDFFIDVVHKNRKFIEEKIITDENKFNIKKLGIKA